MKFLQKNILINSISNIKCYKLAAGNKNEKAYINVSQKANLSSFTRSYNVKHKEMVEVVRIDDFLKDKTCPSFVRMDVEGFEWAIIEGARKTLLNDRLKYLLIEIHPSFMSNEEMEGMISAIKNSGFKTAAFIDSGEPNLALVNARGKLRLSVKWITRLMGEEMEDKTKYIGKNQAVSCNELLTFLKTTGGVHALFIKG